MGRAFVFGDDVNTDALAPGRYLRASHTELAAHCLETLDPDFARSVMPGDILVAGANFGMGSSREQAAGSLKVLGIGAVLARSVARTFFRNAINLGLPVLTWDADGKVSAGNELSVDVAAGRIDNLTTGAQHEVAPLPESLMAIIRDGGLVPHLKNGLANGTVVPGRPLS